jgi:hypothetical protein
MQRSWYARGAVVVMGLIALGLSGAACGPTSGDSTWDASHPDGQIPDGNTCESGDPVRCDGNAALSCVNGSWATQDCGTRTCVSGMGCRLCTPNEKYCSSKDETSSNNEVYLCSPDGTTSSFVEDCGSELRCYDGSCLEGCALAAHAPANVGCEFWAVDLPNSYQCKLAIDPGTGEPDPAHCQAVAYSCAACQQFTVVVANASAYDAEVTVEQNNAAPGEGLNLEVVDKVDVPAGQIHQFDLPMREVDCTEWYTDADGRTRRSNASSTCLTSRAYRVTSNSPVVAYQFNPLSPAGSNAASLLLPTSGLGRDHYLLGWETTFPRGGVDIEGYPLETYVTVVGVTPGTKVTVSPTHRTLASPDGVISAAEAGESVTATLGPFDVLTVMAHEGDDLHLGDLSGTRISADQPVVVFSGSQASSVPEDDLETIYPDHPDSWPPYTGCCGEHFEQQLLPTSTLGKRFVVTRSPIRDQKTPEPDFYRVLAVKDGTVVSTTLPGNPSFTLEKAGDWARFYSAEPGGFVVSANEPIVVAQYLVNGSWISQPLPGAAGDPEFLIFPAEEQQRSHTLFFVPPGYPKNYTVILGSEHSVIMLDPDTNHKQEVSDVQNTACTHAVITDASGTYWAHTCEIAEGSHVVSADVPVQVTVYGYSNVSSYGYSAGSDLKEINPG